MIIFYVNSFIFKNFRIIVFPYYCGECSLQFNQLMNICTKFLYEKYQILHILDFRNLEILFVQMYHIMKNDCSFSGDFLQSTV